MRGNNQSVAAVEWFFPEGKQRGGQRHFLERTVCEGIITDICHRVSLTRVGDRLGDNQ